MNTEIAIQELLKLYKNRLILRNTYNRRDRFDDRAKVKEMDLEINALEHAIDALRRLNTVRSA